MRHAFLLSLNVENILERVAPRSSSSSVSIKGSQCDLPNPVGSDAGGLDESVLLSCCVSCCPVRALCHNAGFRSGMYVG